jgi:DNA-binding transcriptional ArsR family regulator
MVAGVIATTFPDWFFQSVVNSRARTRFISSFMRISRARKSAIMGNVESEKDILEHVRAGKLALPPLSFRPQPKSNREADLQPDVIVETSWQGKKYTFAGEVKRYGSDKSVLQAAEQAHLYAKKLKVNPLVIVPWLSHEQLLSLEQRNVSGVDLCGNGVVLVPGELLVFRTGQPNKFPTSRLVRRVYEGTTSLVARVFLLRAEYKSVSEILDEITARGGSITLPTVSKALKQLEEDIIIERSPKQIRLLQPDKLLERLKANYEPPKLRDVARCKLSFTNDANIGLILRNAAKEVGVRLVLSGESSANFYGTMAKEPIDTFYCTEFTALQLEKFGAETDLFSRFPNVEFRKTDLESVYFDTRVESGYNVASPIQAYLELATSDKRGQETAKQISQQIFSDLADQNQKESK